ncbi:MAG: sigma factor-like helix-turn-helix DNA-binding protein [Fimbriimonadales bacterium]
MSRFLDGMTYQEIAAQVGCSTKTVDNALQRVKKKLQRVLERQETVGRSASKGHHARGRLEKAGLRSGLTR